MMSRLSLRRRGVVVAGVVLAGGLVAGGATAFADTTPAPSASSSTSAPTANGTHHHRRAMRRVLLGIHGQATVKNRKTGRFVVREWQRGVITAVVGDNVTVKSADGATWTWTVEKNAKITRGGKKIAESALKAGDTVEVVGRRTGGANDATRVFAPSAAQLAKQQAKAAQHQANG